jgi:hypothetical protein
MVLLLDGRLCSVSDDRNVKVWRLETGVCDLTTHATAGLLYRVVQLHDGRLVVSGSDRDSGRQVSILGE